jgi:hypothetical protein
MRKSTTSALVLGSLTLWTAHVLAQHPPAGPAPTPQAAPADRSPSSPSYSPPSSQSQSYAPPSPAQPSAPRGGSIADRGPDGVSVAATAARVDSLKKSLAQREAERAKITADPGYKSKMEAARAELDRRYDAARAKLDAELGEAERRREKNSDYSYLYFPPGFQPGYDLGERRIDKIKLAEYEKAQADYVAIYRRIERINADRAEKLEEIAARKDTLQADWERDTQRVQAAYQEDYVALGRAEAVLGNLQDATRGSRLEAALTELKRLEEELKGVESANRGRGAPSSGADVESVRLLQAMGEKRVQIRNIESERGAGTAREMRDAAIELQMQGLHTDVDKLHKEWVDVKNRNGSDAELNAVSSRADAKREELRQLRIANGREGTTGGDSVTMGILGLDAD